MKEIKIRNERHVTLFTVPDGASVFLNGRFRKIVYLDETHFSIEGASDCFHIDQYGDRGLGSKTLYCRDDDQPENCFLYFIESREHGWVEVPISFLKEMHLTATVSGGSRQIDGMAYLEDWGAASRFRSAMEYRGRRVRFSEVRENVPPISSYEYYCRHGDGHE